jgi:hypothetical protein
MRRGVTITAGAMLALLSDQARAAVPAKLAAGVIRIAICVKTEAAVSIGLQILSQGAMVTVHPRKVANWRS